MGHSHGIVWTKELIEEKLLEVINALDIDYMPTRSQINKYYGDDKLTNKISKTLGYYGWAKKLGLKNSSNDTLTGKNGEAIAQKTLQDRGYEVERMLQNYPFDLLVNGVVKVDVKYSNLYEKSNGCGFYSFALRKRYPTCDMYILIAHRQDGKNDLYIIPSKDVAQTQISIGKYNSSYNQYLHRFDLLDKYLESLLAI